MNRPFRFWMTSCVAVVMAALGGRDADARERDSLTNLTRASRYSVGETLQRIEASAQQHGFTVFARVDAAEARHGALAQAAVIVFESPRGGTPVMMAGPGTAPQLPLTVRVRSGSSGDTEVSISGARWDGLPSDVFDDLNELPALVADALR